MRRCQVVLSDKASDGLVNIHSYILYILENPIAAANMRKGILNKCKSLSSAPKANPIKHIRQNRELRFTHYKKYIIIYYIDPIEKDTVVVYDIIYSRRDITRLLETK